MRASELGVYYGKDENRFVPWFDSSWRLGLVTKALGWGAFAGSVGVGLVGGTLAGGIPAVVGVAGAALAMNALETSRPAGGVQEIDVADVAEC